MKSKSLITVLMMTLTLTGLSQSPGTKLWEFTAGGAIGSSPAIAPDGSIYFGSDAKKLYAVDPDGTKKWEFTAGAEIRSAPAIGSDGTLYFGADDNKLYAVNADGTARWTFPAGGTVDTSPALGTNGTIYFSSGGGNLYALSPGGTKLWEFNAGVTFRCSPVVGPDGTIYAGSNDKVLYAIRPDGTQKWSVGFNALVAGLAIGADGTIYATTGFGEARLYAINPDGTTRWSFQAGSYIFGSPAVGSDGTIYFGCFDQNLYAVNPDGSQKWKFAVGDSIESTPAIASDGTVYFGCSDQKLYALDSAGTKLWEFAAGGAVICSPVIREDGSVCIGAFNSKFYAVAGSSGLAEGAWPMFHRDPHHTGNSGLALPPHVRLTSPTNGAVFFPGQPISITAAAAAFGTTISQVNFFQGTNLIGTATNPPYSLTWSNASVGSYTLTARATDALGGASTSAPVAISVATRLAINLTSPADGAEIFLSTNITLTADVSDPDATVTKVEFLASTNKLGEATVAPYDFVWTNPPAGPHVLTAKATDTLGGAGSSGPINVTVYATNAVVARNDAYVTAEDTPLNVAAPGVLANDTNRNPTPANAVLVSGAAHGTLNLNADGSFLYTPGTNYNGADSFRYQAVSGSVTSAPATVQVVVTPVNDAPVAQAATITLNEDTQASFNLTGTDADGDPLTFHILTQPLHGNLYLNGQSGNSMAVIYVPFPNYNGSDSFSFSVNDGAIDSTAATASLLISPVSDAPFANNDEYSVAQNGSLNVSATLGVLANDYDGDGQPLTANLVTGPTNGVLTLTTDGSFSYTPNAGFMGYDHFTYAANDGAQTGNTATVTLAVGNEQWDDQFNYSRFNQLVRAIAVATNGDVYAGGTLSRSLGYGGIARWNGRIWLPLGNRPSNGVGGNVNAMTWQGSDLCVGGSFIDAGGRPAMSLARWNGQVWSNIGGGVGGPVNALAVSGNSLYVGGQFNSAGNQSAANIARWDGTNWFNLGSGVDSEVRAIAVGTNGDVYVGGAFTNAGGITVNRIARWNGSAWTSLDSGVSGPVNALVVQGTNLYVAGSFTNAGGITATNVARWDGVQWSALGNGVPGDYIGALVLKDGELYAGQGNDQQGNFTPVQIFKWNGTNWSALPQSLSAEQYSRVLALAFRGSDLIAGGGFTSAGGAIVDYIASWDGQNWHALHNGIPNGSVWAVAPQGTNVYLGGDFTSVAGTPMNRIVRWDGTNWWSLGNGTNSGVNQPVYAMTAASSGVVYVAGDFTQAGAVAANRIARWDGNNWSPLGTGPTNGLGGTVRALVMSDAGELFAGGRFTSAGGLAAKNIAKWNGQSWSALGEGIDGDVLALATSGTDLYAGGGFFTASGLTVNNIARWDGTKWNPVGSGITAPGPSVVVYSLAVRGTELFAGTEIGTSGGQSMPYLVRWDGANWSPIASTLDMAGRILTIRALQMVGRDLYAGGLFSRIDTLQTFSLARWDGANWFALGTGIEGNDPYVNALALRDNELLVGGSFTEAGTKSSTRFARWLLTNAPPVIQLVSPAPGAVFTVGDNISLAANATDPDGTVTRVDFYAGATLLGSRTSAPFSLTWSNVFTGDYLVFATATDNRGEVTTSAPLAVRVVPPAGDIPPTISIVSPMNGAVFTAGQTVGITANATDNDGSIHQVAFYEGSNFIGIVTNSPYTIAWSNAVAGNYTLTALAMDNLGATNSATIQITLQHPPEVFVASPSEGDRYTIPVNVRLVADARDFEGPVSRVDFYTNGVFLATANQFSSPDFSFTWTNAPVGNYTLTAVAIDAFGAATTSAPVHFSVETPNALPQVRILSPAPGAIYSAPTNIAVVVDASDPDGSIQQVQLYSYDFLLGTLTNQPFVFVVRNLTETTYCLNARALDNRGGTSISSQVCVTVTNDPTRMPKYNIIDLGALVGPESRANGINNDGVVVGDGKTPDYRQRAFIYRNGAVQILPLLGGEGLGGGGGALAINDAGLVTGYAADGSGYPHTFLYDGTNMANLGTLGGRQSFGRAISASGQVVGEAEDGNNQTRAFLFSNGVMTNLDSFGGSESGARGINNSGHVVGAARLPSGKTRGFVYNPNTGMTTLGTLGGDNSQALAINNSGQIVGDASTADGYTHAFLYLQGFLVDLGTFGGFNSIAADISERGQIVGWAEDVHLRSHAFLWHNCVLYDLNQLIPPGSDWVLAQANAINESGQIVGFGKKGLVDQNDRAFLLTLAQDSPQRPEDNQLVSFKNGHFDFCMPVPLGSPFVLEASTNLVNWIPVSTNYNRSGLVDFNDPQAGGFSTRFYRAVPLP